MRIVVDSDGGVDDAVALAWLLQHPEVTVDAVTAVWGNVDVDVAGRNLRVVAEAFGATELPVHLGEGKPRQPAPDIGVADFVHGTDGLADIGLVDPRRGPAGDDAVEQLLALADPDRILLTLGPLTNVAAAVEADRTFAGRWDRVVIMGGASADPGNARPGGEANIAHDPRSAAVVLAAGWREPPTLVGLDATHTATFGADEVALLAERRTPSAAFVQPLLDFYRVKGGSFCPPGECPCHDLLAAMVAVDETLVDLATLPATVVEEPGAAWGATVVDRRWLAWRASADFHEQDALGSMTPVRWAVRGHAHRFRSELRRWWT